MYIGKPIVVEPDSHSLYICTTTLTKEMHPFSTKWEFLTVMSLIMRFYKSLFCQFVTKCSVLGFFLFFSCFKNYFSKIQKLLRNMNCGLLGPSGQVNTHLGGSDPVGSQIKSVLPHSDNDFKPEFIAVLFQDFFLFYFIQK